MTMVLTSDICVLKGSWRGADSPNSHHRLGSRWLVAGIPRENGIIPRMTTRTKDLTPARSLLSTKEIIPPFPQCTTHVLLHAFVDGLLPATWDIWDMGCGHPTIIHPNQLGDHRPQIWASTWPIAPSTPRAQMKKKAPWTRYPLDRAWLNLDVRWIHWSASLW